MIELLFNIIFINKNWSGRKINSDIYFKHKIIIKSIKLFLKEYL